MKTCSSSYSYGFSWDVVNNYYNTYTRETDFIAYYWHWAKDQTVIVFSKNQNAWNRFKNLVRLVEKELTLHPIPREAEKARIDAAASRIAYQYYMLTGKIIAPMDRISDTLCSEKRQKYLTNYGNIVALWHKPLQCSE